MKQKDFNNAFVEIISGRSDKLFNPVLENIVDGPVLSARRAIAVYQEDYEARLTEALKNTYRAIHELIGDEEFNQLALDYINEYKSTSSDLDDYGHLLFTFLGQHPIGEEYSFIAEMADFEWNFREVFHLKFVPGMDASELINALQSSGQSSIQLTKNIRLLQYENAISRLHQLKEDSETFDYQIAEYLMLFKSERLVKTHALSKNQFEIVKNIQAGIPLAECFQNAPATVTPQEIQTLFQILGTERLILNFK